MRPHPLQVSKTAITAVEIKRIARLYVIRQVLGSRVAQLEHPLHLCKSKRKLRRELELSRVQDGSRCAEGGIGRGWNRHRQKPLRQPQRRRGGLLRRAGYTSRLYGA